MEDHQLSFPTKVTCLILFDDKVAVAQVDGRVEIYKIISNSTSVSSFQLLVQFQEPMPERGRLHLLLGHLTINGAGY
jgi:hypothetical protein